jgi:hypothetical protein
VNVGIIQGMERGLDISMGIDILGVASIM